MQLNALFLSLVSLSLLVAPQAKVFIKLDSFFFAFLDNIVKHNEDMEIFQFCCGRGHKLKNNNKFN